MKNAFKYLVSTLLGLLAAAVIRRYKPGIVMVTGSVGKTSTKDAVAAVLGQKFYVRKSDKSFNSEFGVPFTILGVGNPWGRPSAWLAVIKSALALLILPNHYPNMLVLEVGADRPGDLKHILRVATPDAVVVTRLPDIPVHVEAYTSPEAVQEEEFSPAYALHAAAPLIIPAGKPHLMEMARRTPARILTYGAYKHATVSLGEITYHTEDTRVLGMRAPVTLCDQQGEIVVRGSVGTVQLLPAAAAIATAHAFGISLSEAESALADYEPPAGRGRILRGAHESTIIDDTYNASPVAMEEALKTLHHFPGAVRRIAVLGDMLELGRYSVQEHERIGALARKYADLVIAVGIRSRIYSTQKGSAEVLEYGDSRSAADALRTLVRPGDVVLVKGSQSIRMERVVEALLADGSDVTKLVRQEKQWKRR